MGGIFEKPPHFYYDIAMRSSLLLKPSALRSESEALSLQIAQLQRIFHNPSEQEQRLIDRLIQKRNDADAAADRITAQFDAIEDAVVRDAIRLFQSRKNWKAVSIKMYGYDCSAGLYKAVSRYLSRHNLT